MLKGTLTVFTERKETVNHSLHAQMISSDLQHPTSPTFLMSVLINMLILSAAVLYSHSEVKRQNKGETLKENLKNFKRLLPNTVCKLCLMGFYTTTAGKYSKLWVFDCLLVLGFKLVIVTAVH